MRSFLLFPTYIVWHYTGAIRDYIRFSANLLWFILNFFSIKILLETLVSPWRRLAKDETSKHANFMTDFIVNVLMRISGFFIRSFTIVFGLACFVVCAILSIAGFICWLMMPALILLALFYGISFIIAS